MIRLLDSELQSEGIATASLRTSVGHKKDCFGSTPLWLPKTSDSLGSSANLHKEVASRVGWRVAPTRCSPQELLRLLMVLLKPELVLHYEHAISVGGPDSGE